MPKVFVVVENNDDGQPMWDEAEFKKSAAVVRPSHRLSYQERRNDLKKAQAQNADRYHKTQTRAKKHVALQPSR